MTDYKQIARDAIACGLLTPPAPVVVAPKPPRTTMAEIRARGKCASFKQQQERLRNRICAVPTCGKPAKFSERLGRHIERCEECAKLNLEASMRRAHANK
jgi:hypothetical protein